MTDKSAASAPLYPLFIAVLFLMTGLSASAVADSMEKSLVSLQTKWATIKYQETDKDQQNEEITKLADQAEQVSRDNPERTEPLIWQAIIISTKADLEGGRDALHDAERARDILMQAKSIDPLVMNGVVYTSLGVLYYKVPGWPLGFGDKKLAKEYLEKGLALDPDGLDSNFFYGDFLYEAGDYLQAQKVLQHGYEASDHLENTIATNGRRQEIQQLLTRINSESM